MKYQELLEKIQNALKEDKPSEAHHSYAQATALRVNFPKHKTTAKPALRKTDVVTKEWNKEVQQTSNCSSHIEATPPGPPPGAHLIPKRVHRFNMKNYASQTRKMVVPPQENEIQGSVSVIPSTHEKKQDELLLDMMKRREERQFRIEKPLS